MESRSNHFFLLTLTLALGLASCGAPPPVTEDLVWPAAPAKPQIQYVGSFHGSADLGLSFFSKVKDFLFGKPAPLAINKPYGITIGLDSKLYVAETAVKGILVYDIEGGRASFHNSLGRRGALLEPVYVITDKSGNIYVSDTKLRAVVVFSSDFETIRYIGGPEVFESPVGLAFDEPEEELYVVDTRGHNVQVFDLAGNHLRTIGKRGDERGEFYFPTTVAIKGDTVYIVDSFHFAVQAFTRNGEYLFSFGPTPSGPGSLARPRDIGIDADGYLYITDATRNNVQVFLPDGQLLMTFGETGVAPGEFQLPAGIAIAKDGSIYVADSINRRIQIFKRLSPGS